MLATNVQAGSEQTGCGQLLKQVQRATVVKLREREREKRQAKKKKNRENIRINKKSNGCFQF